MGTKGSNSELAAAADRAGVATHYVTSDGERIDAEKDAIAAVLEALGPPPAESIAEPVVCAWQGRGAIGVRGRGAFNLDIDCEDGTKISTSGEVTDGAIELPMLPLGVHKCQLRVGPDRVSIAIIAAPNRCYRPPPPIERRWGTFAPLYAIGRRTGHGGGDLRDLETLCEITSAHGGSIAATLPLLSSFQKTPIAISPYSPISRLYWNPIYLDIEAIAEWRLLPARLRETTLASARELQDYDYVDHPALYARLEEAMSQMAELATAEGARADDQVFAAFLASHYGSAKVHAFAQREMRRQLAGVASRARDSGVDLYLDLPVGSHPLGYDVTRYQPLFATDMNCGAPPDLLFSGGQNWGFPPLHPARIREDGYSFVRKMIANHCEFAGILRIDHVMWLHRIYCVPEGFSAKDGVYIHYNPEELWAIFCLESHRHHTLIVGEDLGTVPDAVTRQMNARGALGMHLFQFGLGGDPHDAIAEPRAAAVASLGSHDTPPFAAYWTGTDIGLATRLGHLDREREPAVRAERQAINRAVAETLAGRELIDDIDADTDEVAVAALSALASSEAQLLLVSIEDLWGETRPQNVPGTVNTELTPNWTRRSKVAIDELAEPSHPAHAVLAEIDRRRRADVEPISLRAAARELDARRDVTAVSDDDLYLFGEGNHLQAFDFLGAHSCEVDGVKGTRFGVWAPNAERVSVIGSWNHWNRDKHVLEQRQVSGVWEGFVAGALVGDHYKFAVQTPSGAVLEKADPVAFAAEVPPKTASRITNLDYTWHDAEWMQSRADHSKRDKPVSIYELHLGSFMRVPEESNRSLTYREAATRIADHVDALGFTHVELLPVMEHPFYGSWGYQSTGYFAPTARYGSPQDLMALVDHLHQRGIGVILDWVPSHFPNDAHGLAEFDGTHLFEHADPRLGFHPDWQSCIFNYGRNEVRSFLISSALFWLHHYHVDGIRVDAVASMLYRDYSRKEGEWIPNRYGGRENLEAVAFLRQLNEAVYSRFPGVETYAEESTAWPGVSRPTFAGGLGFGYKWDMGWMHDTLRYLGRDPLWRKHHQGELSFRMMYAFSENYVLSLSHDEVVHGKGSLTDRMPGDRWQKFANLRLLYGNMFANPGKKLLFMGQEFAQPSEWNHEQSLDWHLADQGEHAGVLRWVRDLNSLYRREPALHELDCEPSGFEWIDYSDAERSIFAFIRRGKRERPIVVIANYTPEPAIDYRVGVPRSGQWHLIANSDDRIYGGSGAPVAETLVAEEHAWHGRSHSITTSIPPLAIVMFA